MSSESWRQPELSVSVVIPTFNRPDALVRAVQSALSQTVQPAEIIVVNDSADPRMTDGVAKLQSQLVRIIQTDLPSGDAGATARNAGVAVARGWWVAFLDDDDEWLPQKLEKQLSAVGRARLPDKMVLAGKVERRTGELSEYWPVRPIRPGESIGHYLFVRRVAGEGWLPTPTLMVSRSFATQNSFRQGMKQHEDHDWLLEAERRGAEFVVVEDVVARVHVSPGAPSMSTNANWEASLAWANSRRQDLGEMAYSAFCLTEVSRLARSAPSVPTFWKILSSGLKGRPRLRDLSHFLARWILPGFIQNFLRETRERSRW